MHIIMLTNSDEESRHGYDDSSLDTADAHLVEVGVERLKAKEELLLEKAAEYGPNTITMHQLFRDLFRHSFSLIRLCTLNFPPLMFRRTSCYFSVISQRECVNHKFFSFVNIIINVSVQLYKCPIFTLYVGNNTTH